MQIKPKSDLKSVQPNSDPCVENQGLKSQPQFYFLFPFPSIPAENNILALYRSDVIDLITIFGLKNTCKKTYLKKEVLRDFRLLAELIVANLSNYELKLFLENHIPTHMMNVYDHFMNIMDSVSDQTCPLHDKIHTLLLISSDEFFKIPFSLHVAIHIMKLIVADLQSEEQKLFSATHVDSFTF